ncbi:ketopantoate reductase family protein [Aliidiomarina taiwanensis]|nr:2-dehydropantoate 2-reductase [Aliidiomarina taiwanensis]
MSQPPWVIVGTGAIGSILGARLLQQQQSVYFVTRSEATEAHLQVTGHTQLTGPVQTVHQGTLQQLPANAVWVFPVKAWQLASALTSYQSALSQAQHIIISHNGLGAAEEALQPYQGKLIDWVTTHGGWRKEKYHTVHSGMGQNWLGMRHGEQAAPTWWPLWQQAFSSEWEPHIALRRWHKLAINCAINPLATLANSPNGELQKPHYQADIQAVCEEVSALMQQALPQHTQPVRAENLYQHVQQVIAGTAENINSMLQDVRAKRPTEVDYLNGFVHKKGRQLHVPTPVNSRLWQAILALN